MVSGKKHYDYPLKEIIPGWEFHVAEISQGYYRVKAIDSFGRAFSRDGIDPDALIEECKKDIFQLSSDDQMDDASSVN